MAISVTQRKSALTSASTPTRTLTFDATPSSGGTVIVGVLSRFGITSVADNKSNTYVRDLNLISSGICHSVWRAANITGGATFTVTVTISGTGTRPVLWYIAEINLPLVLEKQRTNTGSSSTATTGSLTGQTLNIEQYGVAMLGIASITTTFAPPPDWTMIASNTASSGGIVGGLFDQVFTPTALTSVSWPLIGPRPWTTGLATYRSGLVANFSGTPTSGAAPLSVDFTDSSSGSPTSWSWNFGDGQVSTSQNPTNIYAAAGSYTVTLVASSATETDTEVKTDYIVVDAGSPVGGTPTPPGIPTAKGPGFFDPYGPMGQVPGTMAFLIRHAPPPAFSTPAAATEAVSKPVLIPLVLRENLARLERASRNTAMYINALLRAKILYRVDETTFALRGGGFSSEREPTEDDDETIGAQVGTPWVYGTEAESARVWLCALATAGAAEWVELVLSENVDGLGGLTGTF